MRLEKDAEKLARFEAALRQFIERIAEDRYVLAVVLVGSLTEEIIWRRESLSLWIIEADAVEKGPFAKVRRGIALRSQVDGAWVGRDKLIASRLQP